MSAVPQQPTPFDSLALVNSFYGPGATACWYLMSLSCLISWTLHPRKRKVDAIASDFVAVVTFPTVASAHLVTQIRSWPTESSVNADTLEQKRASLAASLIITETYLSFCLVLLLPGHFAHRAPKRQSLLAVTGIFCVVSETYLHFGLPSIRNTPGVFERSFSGNSLPMLVLTLILVSVLVAIWILYLYILFRRRPPEPIAEPPPGADSDNEQAYGLANQPPQITVLAFMSLPLVFILFVFTVSSSFLALVLENYTAKRTIWSALRGIIDDIFPRTGAGIMDLDQTTALLAGITILGFSFYSAADAWYKRWWAEEKKRREESARWRIS